MTRDWVNEAKLLFRGEKPEHFTNFTHCEECAEHDRTLVENSIETIGLEELGNPAWDPICFATEQGKLYYMPALIRLSVATIDDDFYLGQLLFHLEGDGPDNALYLACNAKQRKFIGDFVEEMILCHAGKIAAEFYENEALRVQEIWSTRFY